MYGKKSSMAGFFKGVWYFFVAICLFLIYWSSLLQEEKIASLTKKIDEVEEVVKEKRSPSGSNSSKMECGEGEKPSRHTASSNLLHPDPYYQNILPRLLVNVAHPSGTLRMASLGKTENLHPFSEWAYVVEWMGYVQRGLLAPQFAKYQVLAPEIAYSIEEEEGSKMEPSALFTVRLRDDVYWQPLQQVHFAPPLKLAPHFLKKHKLTAYDFLFYYQTVKNPHVDVAAAITTRELIKDIEDVKVVDDYTLSIRYKKKAVQASNGSTQYLLPYVALLRIAMIQPLARFVYQYAPDGNKLCPEDSESDFYMKSSVFAQQFSRHFAMRVIPSCGPYVFDGATDRMIRFKRNREFYEPLQALYNEIEISLVDSPDTMWRDFLSGKSDICIVPPSNVADLDNETKIAQDAPSNVQKEEIKTLTFLSRVFYYLGLNLERPYFMSKKTRQALSMAVDYERMVHQILNDQGVTLSGPFFKESKAYDQSIQPWPYDKEAALRLLAEDGWYDSDGDGILDKEIGGRRVPFQFSITYFSMNPISKAYSEMLSSYFRDLGIDCGLRGVSLADLSQAFEDRTFDALFLAWTFAVPPEDPEQLWSSKYAHVKGSSNMVGFANQDVDMLIEQLRFERNEEERIRLYHRLHRILHDEAPYLFLYTPKETLAYWSRVHNLFIPKDRQDLIPGADVTEPSPLSTWKSNPETEHKKGLITMAQDTLTTLAANVEAAEAKVKKGDIYVHYRDRSKKYEVVCIALLEENEEPCVVYKALYEPSITWVRPVKRFLEMCGDTPRFIKVS